MEHLPSADDVIRTLGLQPLPHEGGLFTETFRDEHSTAIYFMLVDPMVSRLHLLNSGEVYHWYAGAPLQMLLLFPDGHVEEPVLGPHLHEGQRPQLRVPAGVWQGSRSAGAWSLVGTTMAPPFDWRGFVLGNEDELVATYPQAREQIRRLLA
jgi:predicted cupin superfamily sugar epimerase